MKITYDKKVDALNVELRPGVVAETREVAPEGFLDMDKHGKALYLEIVGGSEKMGVKNFSKITFGSKSFRLPA